ncbi:MAG: malectin domain-containing carbohydrate-binding protein, partial [Heteroscytonema crispum UTEX LB 1556]
FITTGGPGYTFEGQILSADRNFSGGKTYSNTRVVSATDNIKIYQTERYGNFKYNLPVPNGAYIIRLHFAEIFHTSVNKRKFNVTVENGQGALNGYDIVARAGGPNIAKVEEFKSITVTDGILNIDFTSVIDNAKVSAIEIISAEPPNTAPRLVKQIADQQLSVSVKTKTIAFDSVFADNEDQAQLVYT